MRDASAQSTHSAAVSTARLRDEVRLKLAPGKEAHLAQSNLKKLRYKIFKSIREIDPSHSKFQKLLEMVELSPQHVIKRYKVCAAPLLDPFHHPFVANARMLQRSRQSAASCGWEDGAHGEMFRCAV
eukprot:3932299-Rhodomonas_salina.3